MTEDEARLVSELAARDWLRGDRFEVLVVCDQPLHGRHRVHGLDEDGHSVQGRRSDGLLDAIFDVPADPGHTTVRGPQLACLAVGLYRAAGLNHSWFAITPHRLAVLRLRDLQDTAEGATAAILEEAKQQRSLGGALRGIGKLVKTSATELAKSVRRPPLAERPRDAVLECPFEAPRTTLHSIVRWKQPMVPTVAGGPRFVQIQFTDDSWARLQTDEPGATALTGPEG